MSHVGPHLWLFALGTSDMAVYPSPLPARCSPTVRQGEADWKERKSRGPSAAANPRSGHFPGSTWSWKLYHKQKKDLNSFNPLHFQVFLIPLMGLRTRQIKSSFGRSKLEQGRIRNCVWEISWFHQRNLSLSYHKINEKIMNCWFV